MLENIIDYETNKKVLDEFDTNKDLLNEVKYKIYLTNGKLSEFDKDWAYYSMRLDELTGEFYKLVNEFKLLQKKKIKFNLGSFMEEFKLKRNDLNKNFSIDLKVNLSGDINGIEKLERKLINSKVLGVDGTIKLNGDNGNLAYVYFHDILVDLDLCNYDDTKDGASILVEYYNISSKDVMNARLDVNLENINVAMSVLDIDFLGCKYCPTVFGIDIQESIISASTIDRKCIKKLKK